MKIAVGMSGGIDSSTSAILLKNQGYDIIGITLKFWSENCGNRSDSCCPTKDLRTLKSISTSNNFQHYTYTLIDEFYNEVVQYYINSFKNGHTPQPCTICNKIFKWKFMAEFSKKLDCSHIATGHYARIKFVNDQYWLQTAKDLSKDQTFFLWALTQEQLSKTIFPVGELTKSEVRQYALSKNLPNWNKDESMDVCFIRDNNKEFLKRQIPNSFKSGNIKDLQGNIVGTHDGIAIYTVGQKKGLNLFKSHLDRYIIKIDPMNNELIVGDMEELLTDVIPINNIHWINFPVNKCYVRLRHNGNLIPCEINNNEIHLSQKVTNTNDGQTAVFYSEKMEDNSRYCLGGAWIGKSA